MIEVSKFGKRGVSKASLKDLESSSKCWVECLNPSEEELKQVSEKSGIPLSELKETTDEEERPRVADLENYSLIVVRAPWFENDAIKTTPVSIFVSKNRNNIVTIALDEVKSVERIKDLIGSNKIDLHSNGLSFFTYRLLDEIFNTYFSILDDLEEKIDDIENAVVETPEEITVKEIFSVKKTLIYFHKALTANREVIGAIEKEYVAHIDKKNVKRFKTLYDDVAQLIDMEGTYRDILTGTLDIYVSSVSNNLNKVMKTLTVVASFILIPTLISGIYGMNFNTSSPFNMPELGWKYGYFFALGLMAASILVTYIFFRKRGWI